MQTSANISIIWFPGHLPTIALCCLFLSFRLQHESVGLALRLLYESPLTELGTGTAQAKYNPNWTRVSEHMQEVLECLSGEEKGEGDLPFKLSLLGKLCFCALT